MQGMIAAVSEGDLGVLFLLVALACVCASGWAFWTGRIPAGVGLAFLAVVVAAVFVF